MNARYALALSLFCLSANVLFSQGIHFKLQYLDDYTWGVFAKPMGVSPSPQSVSIASGQATIVMPNGFEFGVPGNPTNQEMVSVNGVWNTDASVFGPDELPDRQIISVSYSGNTTDIPFDGNAEILLFKFVGDAACPDTIYLIDCGDAANAPNPGVCPFCPEYDDFDYPGNEPGTSPNNDMQVFDPAASPAFFSYAGHYAPSAWNCHDSDADGLANALEDTDGDGQWTPNVDASNLNDPNDPTPIVEGHLNTKLQLLPDEQTWGVVIKPEPGFTPAPINHLLEGRITIVGPADFAPQNLTSQQGGTWAPTSQLIDAPENPGMNYYTFELAPNGLPIELEAGEETILFSFGNNGTCPDSLYLLENFKPAGIQSNDLTGTGIQGGVELPFYLGKVYNRKAWICDLPEIIIIGGPGSGQDSIGTGGGGQIFFAAPQGVSNGVLRDLWTGGKNGWVEISPNPAHDFLKVKIGTELPESQPVVRLFSLHGQPQQRLMPQGGNELLLDLSGLPAGLYFLSFEVDGKVLQRERMVKG